MNRGRLWTFIGLAVAVLPAVTVAVLQFTGVIEDPNQLACDALRRVCNP